MDIKKTAVIGAGLMGKGIAQVLAGIDGVSVAVYDVYEVDIRAGVGANLNRLREKGVLSAGECEAILGRIRFARELGDPGIADADLVIEAVYEDMEVKRRTFEELESVCRADCIFCTNSSVMSPTQVSAGLKHRERFVGTHFWNPAYLIPLVEVIKSDFTSDETALAVMRLLQRAGKKPVLCKKDVPGFIANRMQHALWREAISIVENGIADAETVDDAVKYSFGLRLPRLGPLENADMVGTDLTMQIHDYILGHLEDSHESSPYLKKLNAEGKLGFKSGEGFMKWDEAAMQRSRDGLNDYLIDILYNK